MANWRYTHHHSTQRRIRGDNDATHTHTQHSYNSNQNCAEHFMSFVCLLCFFLIFFYFVSCALHTTATMCIVLCVYMWQQTETFCWMSSFTCKQITKRKKKKSENKKLQSSAIWIDKKENVRNIFYMREFIHKLHCKIRNAFSVLFYYNFMCALCALRVCVLHLKRQTGAFLLLLLHCHWHLLVCGQNDNASDINFFSVAGKRVRSHSIHIFAFYCCFSLMALIKWRRFC